MLFNQMNVCKTRFMGLDDKDLTHFLITEYDTHGNVALSTYVVCLTLRPFTPCCG